MRKMMSAAVVAMVGAAALALGTVAAFSQANEDDVAAAQATVKPALGTDGLRNNRCAARVSRRSRSERNDRQDAVLRPTL